MPRLKSSPQVKRGEIIDAWKRYHDIADEKAATILGMSLTTLKRRRVRGDWEIEELHRAIRGFKIPPEDALTLLTVGCLPLESHLEKERRKKHGN